VPREIASAHGRESWLVKRQNVVEPSLVGGKTLAIEVMRASRSDAQ
jgi:hypothetical protein